MLQIGNSSISYKSFGLNNNASNIQFKLPNNTPLYTFVQNINATTVTLWVRMPYSTSTIYMDVFPLGYNLLNNKSYLGNNETNNAKYVFPVYNNSINTSKYTVNGAIGSIYSGGTNSSFIENNITSPTTVYKTWGVNSTFKHGHFFANQYPANYKFSGYNSTNFNTTNIYATWQEPLSGENISYHWLVDNTSTNQSGNISVKNSIYSPLVGYATTGGVRTQYWRYGLIVPNGIMPLFTIGSSHNLTGNQISFEQVNLPANTIWGVRLNITTNYLWFNGTNDYINFTTLPSGNYSYTVLNASAVFSTIPHSGILTLINTNLTQTITVSSKSSFQEYGLPANTTWSVEISGISNSGFQENYVSNSSVIHTFLPKGTYIYTIGSIVNSTYESGIVTVKNTSYIPNPVSGNVIVTNFFTTQYIIFKKNDILLYNLIPGEAEYANKTLILPIFVLNQNNQPVVLSSFTHHLLVDSV